MATPIYPKPVKTAGTATPTYSPSPVARTGTNAYGYVPGATGLPDPAGDLSKLYPNLTGTNAAISGNIMHELSGELSPETVNSIRDRAASFGVSSGMPGSGLASYGGLRNLGIATEDLQQRGLQDYLGATAGISKTQTVNPETQIGLSQSNAALNAAPDPTMAAKEQQRLFDEYLKKTSGGAQKPWWAPAGPYTTRTYGMGLGGATPWYTETIPA